jgi:hypothetical protein
MLAKTDVAGSALSCNLKTLFLRTQRCWTPNTYRMSAPSENAGSRRAPRAPRPPREPKEAVPSERLYVSELISSSSEIIRFLYSGGINTPSCVKM